jgi:hypothetical protein
VTQPPYPPPGPPGYGYPPPYPQQPYAQTLPAPRNGLGTTGLVLGICGLVFSFIPVVGLVAWPLVILGLIFGGLGLAAANRGEATNRGHSIAGLVCSGLGLVVCVVWLAAFSDAVDSTTSRSSASSRSAPAVRTPARAPAVVAPPVAPTPSGPRSTFGDGTYQVGVDVVAGTFVAPGGGNCYWARNADASGESIIANEWKPDQGQVIVTAKEGEFLEVSDCGTWTKRG